MKKIKSQKPVRSMGIKKVVIFLKTKKGRVEKGIFFERKKSGGYFPEEGSCREV